MQGEHPAEAMALCEVAVQLAPNSATDFDYLGVTQVQLGLYENAALSFERALALDSSINGLLLRVAGAYQELARPEVSQLYLERAAEMFPQDARVYIALGKLSESQGDFAAGQSYLARAIQLDPAEAEGYYLLGRIAFNQGDLSRAQFYLEHATELDAVRPEYFLLLGDLHCTAHNIGEAQESYMQAQTLLPDNAGISEKMRQAETRCR